MIEVQINNFSEIISPTIFPDGTSQVWKLSETLINQIKDIKEPAIVEVVWEFESESELIRVCQLADLLRSINKNIELTLNVPYLPYGRQDKEIDNNQTFGQHTFLNLISQYYSGIHTLDAHSSTVLDEFEGLEKLYYSSIPPNAEISETLYWCNPTLICFPDKGTSERKYPTGDVHSFFLEKKRDPLTGNITGLKSPLPLNLKNQKILIIDDICDDGRIFIEAAKILYEMGAEEVYLYVTHGIFSKGIQVLKDAGIKRIFTRKGEQ